MKKVTAYKHGCTFKIDMLKNEKCFDAGKHGCLWFNQNARKTVLIKSNACFGKIV